MFGVGGSVVSGFPLVVGSVGPSVAAWVIIGQSAD